MKPGIYLVHKPVGQTSFSLVQAFMEQRQAAGIRPGKLPVSHGGALDPFAEGLVLLLAGDATRLMHLFHPIPKLYLAKVAWGAETDNGDPSGRVVAEGNAAKLSPSMLDAALTPFVGWHDQVPPATSNKRVDGERAYLRAHRGEQFELPPSRVYLHEARWLSHDLPGSSTLQLTTGGGYYVRALARDLGRATGAQAHLQTLSRTQIGPWTDPAGAGLTAIQGTALFPWCGSVTVDAAELKALQSRRPIRARLPTPPTWSPPAGFPDTGAPLRAFCEGQLVAMLRDAETGLIADPLLRRPL
jgi:tRNA pseudouridine55 synthase